MGLYNHVIFLTIVVNNKWYRSCRSLLESNWTTVNQATPSVKIRAWNHASISSYNDIEACLRSQLKYSAMFPSQLRWYVLLSKIILKRKRKKKKKGFPLICIFCIKSGAILAIWYQKKAYTLSSSPLRNFTPKTCYVGKILDKKSVPNPNSNL